MLFLLGSCHESVLLESDQNFVHYTSFLILTCGFFTSYFLTIFHFTHTGN